jgi:cytoskeletal protein CcmA (bactofilin family)
MSLILVVIGCLWGPGFLWAEDLSDQVEWQKRVILRAGQEVQGDYFAFGPHVEISGTVHGDVYAAGAEVLVDGVVDGDLIVAGGTVTVSGTVSQDARIAGGNVTLSGTIKRNVTVTGGDVHVTESAHVTGNVLVAAANLMMRGPIDGDVRAAAGNLTLSNEVVGDLMVAAAVIRLTSRASVGRDFRYWSDGEASIDEGAAILGTVTRRPMPEAFKGEDVRRGIAGMKFVAGAVNFASTLILGLLLLRLYPVFTPRVASTIQEQPWVVLGVGGALFFGVPLLIGFCMVSVLGIPIGLMLGAMYLVTLYLGRVFAMLWLGQRLLGFVSVLVSVSVGWAFAAGLVVYFIVSVVPFVGELITFATMVVGLGALILTKKELVVRLREQQMV